MRRFIAERRFMCCFQETRERRPFPCGSARCPDISVAFSTEQPEKGSAPPGALPSKPWGLSALPAVQRIPSEPGTTHMCTVPVMPAGVVISPGLPLLVPRPVGGTSRRRLPAAPRPVEALPVHRVVLGIHQLQILTFLFPAAARFWSRCLPGSVRRETSAVPVR